MNEVGKYPSDDKAALADKKKLKFFKVINVNDEKQILLYFEETNEEKVDGMKHYKKKVKTHSIEIIDQNTYKRVGEPMIL